MKKGILFRKTAYGTVFTVIAVTLVFITLISATGYVEYALILADSTPTVKQNEGKQTVIIDAGHGGEDSGAVGVNNIYEKDLNLKTALVLRDILFLGGYDVIMTRTEDVMLSGEGSGSRKARDLKNRLDFQTRYPEALFLSVHMNKFHETSCRGLQVYYSPNNDKSRRIAFAIQQETEKELQSFNKRQIKKAGSSIYILDRIEIPAVLVECGFISNAEDASSLTDPLYRAKLSAVIFKALNIIYTGGTL